MKHLAPLAMVAALTACDNDRILHATMGGPCDHAGYEGDLTQLLTDGMGPIGTASDPACGAEACVYSETRVVPADACSRDTDCNPVGADGSLEIFACEFDDGQGQGHCVPTSSWVLEKSMCAPACTDDADCVDASADTVCESAFSCAVLFDEGPLACQGLCVCNDDADNWQSDVTCEG